MSKTHQNVSIIFDKCEIVRRGRDTIYFTIATTDGFGRAISHLQTIHNGYDEYNSRSMTIETVSGNGPSLARSLGWALRIDIIDPGDVENPLKYIEAWDFDFKILNP